MNSKDDSNLQLIWLCLLVWTLKSEEPQSVVVALGITSLVLTVSYYRRSIAIPVMDNFINSLEDRMTDRKHTEIFSLLPSVCLSEHFNLDTSAEELIKHFGDKLQCKVPAIFQSELKRWVKQWRIEMENRRAEYSATATKGKEARVNGKKPYNIVEPPDSFLEALKYAEPDFYPDIRQLLIIGCVSPTSSTKVERSASGVCRLKTPYRSTMSDEREGDLNLIQLQRVADVDENEVIKTFIQLHPRRLFTAKSPINQ